MKNTKRPSPYLGIKIVRRNEVSVAKDDVFNIRMEKNSVDSKTDFCLSMECSHPDDIWCFYFKDIKEMETFSDNITRAVELLK